jgi:hypothetical protein
MLFGFCKHTNKKPFVTAAVANGSLSFVRSDPDGTLRTTVRCRCCCRCCSGLQRRCSGFVTPNTLIKNCLKQQPLQTAHTNKKLFETAAVANGSYYVFEVSVTEHFVTTVS